MGGHAAGEVASAMTVDTIRDGFLENVRRSRDSTTRSRRRTGRSSQDARENPEHFGMGTTVIAVGPHPRRRRASVADAVPRRRLERLPTARRGASPAERRPQRRRGVGAHGSAHTGRGAVHPRRHQLTRGRRRRGDDRRSTSCRSNAQPGDRLLLCSDGLSNELDNETLARLASAPIPLDEAVRRSSIEAARDAGGRDNISAVLLEFDEVDVAAKPIQRTVSSAPPPVAPTATRGAVRHARRRRSSRGGSWAASLLLSASSAGSSRRALVRVLELLPGQRQRVDRGVPGPAVGRAVVQAGQGLRHVATLERSCARRIRSR